MTKTTKPSASGRNSLGSAVVKALNTAITAAMTELADRHGCQPMNWYLSEVNGFDRGDVIGFPGPSEGDPADGIRVAQQWATLLGLPEWANETPGYRSWVGLAGTSRIEIWCRTSTAGAA
jgi:hypothetical protein